MGTKAKTKGELKAAEIVQALGSVTKEKSINIELVLDTLKDALATAAKKYLGRPIHIEVEVDRDKGTIEVYSRQFVAEEVEDPETQITLEEARRIDSDLQIGDELIQDLDIDVFGRTAIQTAKQVLVQRVREAEREKVFADYSNRVGELITGTVQQIDKGNILVNLGRTEALLPYKEQIHKERYRQGQTIRGCITEVKNNPKGPQIIVSRTSTTFLERLFELEVPEIYEGIVRIVKVVRAPGLRAKVAVVSNDSRVDPVGACVGMRGNRVQAIVRELSNERMDIINWTDELSMLVRRVFSPAEVKRVLPVGEDKLVVIIKEEDLAQAIGREGQNIRLASRMLDKEIDVYGDEEFAGFTDEEREQALSEEEEEAEIAEGAEAVEGAPEGMQEDTSAEAEETVSAGLAASGVAEAASEEDLTEAVGQEGPESETDTESTEETDREAPGEAQEFAGADASADAGPEAEDSGEPADADQDEGDSEETKQEGEEALGDQERTPPEDTH
ncbi:MAG: transcription termination factor NusA [Chitinivibrionales bacterium]|nr:transcription termination factor NusA [Chitinivibrionales bacterium]MBD3395491.1 transcription termination factor NusA [Chitinivibrionales bacterium]